MAEVDRQIRMIADFVELEAREKCAEIRARAKADADAERQIALVNAKEKLSEEYDRKEKALGVELKMLEFVHFLHLPFYSFVSTLLSISRTLTLSRTLSLARLFSHPQ